MSGPAAGSDDTSPRPRIYLEAGSRRVFACALEWPGWCRSGRDEERAVATWTAYAQRYAPVAAAAGVPFPALRDPQVVERLAGSGSTDFGVPAHLPDADRAPLDADEAERSSDLVAASWRLFDQVVEESPQQLRKGPRGGGRDRDDIVAHVVEAERSYARSLGVRVTPMELAAPGGVAALRVALLSVLRQARAGTPLVPGGWPPRYAARRLAWHVLDHLWEIEDKRE